MDYFDWDDGNWPKCGKHGLTQDEIEYVFQNHPMVAPDKTKRDEEYRYNAVGKNERGKYVFIVFAFRYRDGHRYIRPISARYMHKREVNRYEQRET